MKRGLPASVLLALGLTGGCRECGRGHVGPCLSVMPDPPDPDTAVGPCLEYIPEEPPTEEPPTEEPPTEEPTEEEPPTGPCLSVQPEPEVMPCLDYDPEYPDLEPDGSEPEGAEPEGSAPEGEQKSGARLHRQEAQDRVLARGVLPDDVAALLRDRQRG